MVTALKVFRRLATVRAEAGYEPLDLHALHASVQKYPDGYHRRKYGVGRKAVQLMSKLTSSELTELISKL